MALGRSTSLKGEQRNCIMIVGTGIDIAEVERIAHSIERFGRRFLERVFTPEEIRYCESKANKAERYAGRFAAKEAAMKAIGTGWNRGVTWHDIEVTTARRPAHHAFHNKAAEFFRGLGADARIFRSPTRRTRDSTGHPGIRRGLKRDTFPVIGQLNRVAIVSIMASVAAGGNSLWAFRQGGRGGGFGLAD